VNPSDWNISYKQMEELWNLSDKMGGISIYSETIQCGDKKFISVNEAAKEFGVSGERIRQKLKSDNYKDWKYLEN